MSKKIVNLLSIAFVFSIILSFCASVNAAEDELVLNSDVKAKVGDKVKCAIYMSDCTQKVVGIDMTVMYDSEYLKIDTKSLAYEKFDGAVQNANLDGYFKFNWTQISDEQDFSKRALLVSAEFEVLKGGKTELSHFITDLYDIDMNNIDPYKITYDISVNDDVVAKELPPVINQDLSNEKKLQGSFINYLDGIGDNNSTDKGGHKSFIAEKRFVSQEVQTTVVDVTKYVEAENSGSSSFFSPVTIVVIIACVIIALAVIAVIIVNKKDAENQN